MSGNDGIWIYNDLFLLIEILFLDSIDCVAFCYNMMGMLSGIINEDKIMNES